MFYLKEPTESTKKYNYEVYSNIGKEIDDNDGETLKSLLIRTKSEHLDFLLKFNEFPYDIDDERNKLINSMTYAIQGREDRATCIYRSDIKFFRPVHTELIVSDFMKANFSSKMMVTLYVYKGESALDEILKELK